MRSILPPPVTAAVQLGLHAVIPSRAFDFCLTHAFPFTSAPLMLYFYHHHTHLAFGAHSLRVGTRYRMRSGHHIPHQLGHTSYQLLQLLKQSQTYQIQLQHPIKILSFDL